MDITILFKMAAIGIIITVICQILKKSDRDDIATLVSIVGLVIVLAVVAPISVTTPVSTAPSSESCCALEKRWISSINRMGLWSEKKRLLRARSITSRTSFTPQFIAERV